MVVLPAAHAADFEKFCALNPRPCPLLEPPLPPGDFSPKRVAQGADLRTDLPQYLCDLHFFTYRDKISIFPKIPDI